MNIAIKACRWRISKIKIVKFKTKKTTTFQHSGFSVCLGTHRTHQGVEYTDSEGGAAGEGLSEVQLCVWVVIIILVQELNV